MTLSVVTDALVEAFSTVARMSAEAAVVVVMVLLVQRICGRRLSAVWRHGLWGLVLLRLVMPVVPESRLSVFNVFSLPRLVPSAGADLVTEPRAPGAQRLPELLPPSGPFLPASESDESHSTIAATEIADENTPHAGAGGSKSVVMRPSRELVAGMACVWLFGVLLLSVRTTVAAARLGRDLSHMRAAHDQRVSRAMSDCCRRIGLRLPQTVVVGPPGSEAGIAGIVQPTLIIPGNVLVAFSEAELQNVVLHELLHIRRFDLFWNWAAILATHLHWFNPLVWLAAHCARLDAELACDAGVLAALPAAARAGYGTTLLRLVEQSAVVSPARMTMNVLGSTHVLRQRVRMIACIEARTPKDLVWGLAVTLGLCLAGLTQATGVPAATTVASPGDGSIAVVREATASARQDDVTEKDVTRDDRDGPNISQAMLEEYGQIVQRGDFVSDREKSLVSDAMRWKLSLIRRRENRERAAELRLQVQRDIAEAGKDTGQRSVRKFLLDTIVEETPKILKADDVAAINGAILLAELNEEEADGDKPARPYRGAAESLLKIVNEPQHRVAVRLWGVKGLVRLASDPQLPNPLRKRIVTTLVAQLDRSGRAHEWYQWRLVEGLGLLDLTQDENEWRDVVGALSRVMGDADRTWRIRAESARSLGWVPYDRDFDAGRLADEIARLAQEMADASESEPQQKKDWKACAMLFYGAFKPLGNQAAEQKQGLLTQANSNPALARYQTTVQAAFDRMLPLAKKILKTDVATSQETPERLDDR
jgi:beta-lactamase regulating signal transducer with metallopeptidase domain